MNDQLSTSMMSGLYDDMMPPSEGEGDASMEMRPMSSEPMKPSGPAPAETAPASEEGFGMMHRPSPEEPSPQGLPSSGKEQFHNAMSDFGHRAEANRAAVIGLNPSDPDYLKKLEALQAQHGAITQEKARYQMLHPWGGPESAHPGVLGKIGHVAGEIGQVAGSAITPNLMQDIPGSQANIRAQGAGGVEQETGAIGNEAKTEGAEAKETTADTKADIAPSVEHKNEAMAGAAEAKPQAAQDANTINLRKLGLKAGPTGQPVPLEYAEMSPQEQAVNDLKTAHTDLAEAQADLAKFKSDPNSPMFQMAQRRVQVAERNAQTAAQRANLQGEKQAQEASGEKPTNQTKAMSEMAQTVLKQVPNIKSQVDKLADKIGPGAGRWNQFWVNKGGVDDPDFAGLDTDLDLFASALVRTHFGARGGQQYREELRKQFSQAQSPEDLKSRIDHADTWIQGYANAGHPDHSTSSSKTSGGIKAAGKQWNALKGKYE